MRTDLPPGQAWQKLAAHYELIKEQPLRNLFTGDRDRGGRFALELGPLYLDFSKNHLTEETIELLTALTRASKLDEAIDQLYSGATFNTSEGRAALHTALRGGANNDSVDAEVNTAIQSELTRMQALHQRLVTGQWLGFSGKPIDTIVNIGIGGSDLGPRLLTEALTPVRTPSLRFDFVTNIDPADFTRILAQYEAPTTLFIISSKSFTTLETCRNYRAARDWLHHAGCDEHKFNCHFLAATANPETAVANGIHPDHVFRFWDWVGGRYSIWSAAGLAAFLAIGPQRFGEFLAGGKRMDQHFRASPPDQNLPVMLALIGIWYINFFNYSSHAIIPYEQRLALLPSYLCQLVMESLGKSVTVADKPLGWQTAPVTWGGVGTNSQHSFFQALHQGTQTIPVDFLVGLENPYEFNDQHTDLFSSCLAQSRALMTGTDNGSPFQACPGNRPSNTLLYETLSAETLGMLLALYEHKTFVQAHLWHINPFDQWGVELGKRMGRELGDRLRAGNLSPDSLDSSTLELMQRFHARKSR